MTLREELLAEIEAFLKAEGMRPETFGSRAMDDGKFVKRLRSGADVRTETFERVREFIRQNAEPARP